MRLWLILTVAAIVLLIVPVGVIAQTGGEPDHINRWTLGASTGGIMTSSSFGLYGTTGQASTALASGPDRYSVGGIWMPHYIHPVPVITELPEMGDLDTPIEIEEPEISDIDLLQTIRSGSYFPTSLNLPSFPPLTPPQFPSTLGLPNMPTLTLISYITDVFSPIISLTTSIMRWDQVITSSLFLPSELSQSTGIGVDGFEGGSGSASMDLEIAGYTATELANELITGMDVALSYIRSIRAIGVIGPTAAAMLIGMGWIAFVAFAKILIKVLLAVIHFVIEIWRLLPFT